jgi:predicted TIM-barrel fold metal-dependent hydrolase
MKFIDTFRHKRILFGSDIPFGMMKWELEKVLSLPIGDDKKEWVLSKNLKRLIGLEEIEFIFHRNESASRMIAFDKIVKN